MKLKIRRFLSDQDKNEVFRLWQKNYGKLWPLAIDTFSRIINTGDHFITAKDKEIISFIATQVMGSNASILTIIGEDIALLDYSIKYLKSRGVKKIQLGDGGNSYFWPGIPVNLPKQINFFNVNGWEFTEDSYDLVMNVNKFHFPANLNPAKIELANQNSIKKVLTFEAINFPEWLAAYQRKVELKDFNDIFYAEDKEKNVLGTVFVFSKKSNSAKEHQVWKKILGTDMGGICCLGVKPDQRKQGVGLALAAYAPEQLRARKAGNVFVGYTWLVDWYGKLGYKIWRQYKMCWKAI